MSAPAPTAIDVEAEHIKSFKSFITSYNKLSEICFTDCAYDFTTREITDKEDKCSTMCMEKYLKMNQRISQRFQEHQMIMNESAMANAKKLGQI